MAPIVEEDYIRVLGYSILYKEDNIIGFNHQKTLLNWSLRNEKDWTQIPISLGFRGFRVQGIGLRA